MVTENLLLLLVLLPLLGAFVCLLTPNSLVKPVALGFSLVGLALGIALYTAFDPAAAGYSFVFSRNWIPSYGIRFALGIDTLSFPLVVLSKLMVPIAILASWSEERRIKAFMFCYLLLDSAMVGTFLAMDIFVFYIFWEVMLIPMLLLIGVWGSKERVYASVKFFLYTFAGSILMLVSIFYVYLLQYRLTGTYNADITALYRMAFAPEVGPLHWNVEDWVFWGFAIAFLIKVPLFPLHTWLPDAHVQAPTGGSVLLAAVLLKMGTYGLLRLGIPICPNAFHHFNHFIAALSVIGIIYGAFVAFQQTDFKKLVAYSSVSHMGFVVLGICAFNAEALNGAMLQMINHGLSTGALFFLVGALYERRHTRDFSEFGGIASVIPFYSFALVYVAASSMGVPGLNGFVGEFLVLLGAYQANPLWSAISVLGVVFGAAYILIMLRKVLFGAVTVPENRSLKDLSTREWMGLAPLLLLILWLGISPKSFMAKFEPGIQKIITESRPVEAPVPVAVRSNIENSR